MKILAIIGSPKGKGNSYKVTKEVEEKMNGMEDVTFEYLFLKDVDLQMCRGCFSCVIKGENFCPIKDDRAEIEDKMLKSDGIIFVTPCYCQNVSALMKNFIDRLSYVFHRPRFFNQKAMVLATTGGAGLKETLDYLSKLEVWGFGPVITLGAIYPPWPASEGLKIKNNKKIVGSVEEFYKKLKGQKHPSPGFNQYMHFRFMKMTSDMKEYLPADNEFYKDKNEFFYPVKINPFKKGLASLMIKIAMFMMRDMGPEEVK
ncbi:flavodoxin family protein [Methanobacterium paludis]|uniref:NADPH-dependent FMN reductase n=1 Tax=Methanobacterium paludis (strain DSM 25820 / JCM 18151 / SWAN1) TaxID=868131 RepID=F6D400_METPW|nr:flavodoxin family protein [Methanobacterium paludis]AEG19177.1 NADPH-dependent FMN reductase [Methanobacterium paludis]